MTAFDNLLKLKKDGFLEKFFLNFKKNVGLYLKMFKRAPLNNIHLEEVMVNSFEESNMKVTNWTPGSHDAGPDFNVQLIGGVQSKGCLQPKPKIYKRPPKNKPTPKISFSSSRTGSKETLCEKMEYLEIIHKSWENILLLERSETNYSLLAINPEILSPQKFKWKERVSKRGKNKGKVTALITTNESDVNIKIEFGTSHQLWVDINRKLLNDENSIFELLKVGV